MITIEEQKYIRFANYVVTVTYDPIELQIITNNLEELKNKG